MKKPTVVWIVVVIAGAAALLNVFGLLCTLAAARGWPPGVILMQIVLGAGTAFVSAWILRRIILDAINSKAPILLYLLFLFAIYPIRNAFASSTDRALETLNSGELLMAAIAEIFRYVALTIVILWVAASGALRSYLRAKEAASEK